MAGSLDQEKRLMEFIAKYKASRQIERDDTKPVPGIGRKTVTERLKQLDTLQQALKEAELRKKPYVPLYHHPFVLSKDRNSGPLQVIRGTVMIFPPSNQENLIVNIPPGYESILGLGASQQPEVVNYQHKAESPQNRSVFVFHRGYWHFGQTRLQ